MVAFLLASLGTFFLLAAVHPFTTYPLSLFLLRRLRPAAPLSLGGAAPKTYGVCLCAYNEAAVIQEKIENLLALRTVLGNETEIHVYVDAATDKTADILRGYADRIDLVVSDKRQGKTAGMGILVQRARAEILIFTDANVFFDIESLKKLPDYFRDPAVGCVCGHLKYVNEVDSATAVSGSLYWKLEEYVKQAESDTGSIMGADGSIFAVRRGLYPVVPADIIDDFYVSMDILIQGHRVVRASDVVAYEKSIPVSKDEFRRKVRIACQAFNVHRLIWPRVRSLGGVNVYKYVSHKLFHWLSPYFLLLGFVFSAAGGFVALGAWREMVSLSCVALIWGIALACKVRLVVLMTEMLGAFYATGIGVWKSCRGERFQTWNPAMSIRNETTIHVEK